MVEATEPSGALLTPRDEVDASSHRVNRVRPCLHLADDIDGCYEADLTYAELSSGESSPSAHRGFFRPKHVANGRLEARPLELAAL